MAIFISCNLEVQILHGTELVG